MLEPSTKPSLKWRRGIRQGLYDDSDLHTKPFWPLSVGEAHYFYWFIQGGIMNVDTRRALRRGWGLCERHAWGALAVGMCFQSRYLLAPAILYEDLLDRCVSVIPRRGPSKAWRFARRLRPQGPCMACEMRIFRAGTGLAEPACDHREWPAHGRAVVLCLGISGLLAWCRMRRMRRRRRALPPPSARSRGTA